MAERDIYLCHKCWGLLSKRPEGLPLKPCRCISGYVRDFQTPLTYRGAVEGQLKATKDRMALFESQGRPEFEREANEEQVKALQEWLEASTCPPPDRKNPHLLMSSVLYPSDGVPGCTFEVGHADEHDYVKVTLRSPYRDKGVVEEATIPLVQLGIWLDGRSDY
jgi:hypothetical protein